MITRSITRPITSPIARSVTGAYGAAWNPRALFALGEQGVIYDPSDLSTLWQDSTGTTPVTAAGQPVGLMLDKRLGLVRGADISGAMTSNSASVTYAGGVATFTGAAVSNGVATPPATLAIGKTYEITFRVVSIASGSLRPYAGGGGVGVSVTSAGTYTQRLLCATNSTGSIIALSANTTAVVDSISFREIHGNHGFQATASAKPFVRDTPRRIDYDADDSLGITFPVSLGAACTVARSIPGVGAQILTAQTIGTSFSDNIDNCGLIIINRALNAAETANLTRYLNQRAGV